MNTIKDILQQVIGNLSLNKPDDQNKIQRIWQNIIDTRTAQHSVLSNFSDGLLTVVVDSSSRLFQMNLQKKKILEQLQDEIPQIKNIQFKIGKVK